MAEEKLTVSSLISFSKDTYTEILDCIKILSGLTQEYRETDNLDALEKIKREFNAHLERYATLYSQTKKYKGDTHTYLSEHRKRFKGETMKLLIDEGLAVTAADKLIYAHPHYVKRLNLLEDITEFFIRTEELFQMYNTILQSIVQSISVQSKQFSNSKSS
jgi:hypothetical protein